MNLLKPDQTAERLSISRATLSRYVQRGEIPFVRLPGGHIRFSEDDLTAWIKARRVVSRSTRKVA